MECINSDRGNLYYLGYEEHKNYEFVFSSILSGLINKEFVFTGHKIFDLDFDLIPDIGFEIIDLNKFNSDGIPESFDTLAAIVIPIYF